MPIRKVTTKVLYVSSECYPLAKTGGLGDVVGALPLALEPLGVDTRVFMPAYPGTIDALVRPKVVGTLKQLFGGAARVISGTTVDGLKLLLLDATHLYDRGGGPYSDASGADWVDNDARFAALSFAAAQLAQGALGRWRPDIVHAHDWQAGLTAAYLRFAGAATPTVLTIHNLAFQGVFPASRLTELELPAASYNTDGLEFHGQISMLKAGLVYSDVVTTVSPTYAQEIRGPRDGAGMDGVLAALRRPPIGIINGIDETVWNPATDSRIAARLIDDIGAFKAANAQALRAEFGLDPTTSAPLFGVVSRLSQQKGFDLLIDVLPQLLQRAQLVVLGSGDREIEAALLRAAKAAPGRIGVRIGYDEHLAHRIQAGSDVILVPSRFEPCGLTQLCALRYAALPVVTRVGGLADTVIDANTAAVTDGVATGFVFAPVTSEAFSWALERVFALWNMPDIWNQLRRRAVTRDVSWKVPAVRYNELYDSLMVTN